MAAVDGIPLFIVHKTDSLYDVTMPEIWCHPLKPNIKFTAASSV
jgi:hypothetical protein